MQSVPDKFSNNRLQKYRNEKIKRTFCRIFDIPLLFLAVDFLSLTGQLAPIPEKFTSCKEKPGFRRFSLGFL